MWIVRRHVYGTAGNHEVQEQSPMADNSIRLHVACNPRSPRLSVEELVASQPACEALRRHIGAEPKRLEASGWMEPDDVFQEMFTRGLNADREGRRGSVL